MMLPFYIVKNTRVPGSFLAVRCRRILTPDSKTHRVQDFSLGWNWFEIPGLSQVEEGGTQALLLATRM